MKILSVVLLVLTILSGSFTISLSLAPQAQPKLVKVPGTKVSIVPPAGLKPSGRFPGFGDEETSSSILITEMPAPYSKFTGAFTNMTIDGLAGSEIIAEAQWKDLPDTPVTVYQVLLLDGKNYFMMQGFAPREEREKYLTIFNRIAQSFRKK